MRIDLPYLFSPRGRTRRYYYYRRAGQRIPIEREDGQKVAPGETGFLDAYNRIHESFENSRVPAGPGSLSHLIETYRGSPEFFELAEKTRRDYMRYLDYLKKSYGSLAIRTMPREFVIQLRDKHQSTPRKANYLVSVLRLLMSFAEDRPNTFRLPNGWQNPARRPKRLKTGDGHRPWEEYEISAFRDRWEPNTIERIAFEIALNTGQRGGDIIAMTRQHYRQGEFHVGQQKTGERVWIPASAELRAVLDPWLEAHQHLVILATKTGRPLKVDRFRHLMRDAYRSASLADDCTTHGLRYTAAEILGELGCGWKTIAAITGHRTAEMVRKYTDKHRRAKLAIARLDAARGQTEND